MPLNIDLTIPPLTKKGGLVNFRKTVLKRILAIITSSSTALADFSYSQLVNGIDASAAQVALYMNQQRKKQNFNFKY